MIFNAYDFHFEDIQSQIEFLYIRLQISINRLLKMVDKENDLNDFYNPKKHIIQKEDHKLEFEKYQSLIRGLNNYVYYNSLLLSSYSIFENSLKLICKFISEHINPQIELEEFRRDILKNCINYIMKTKLVNFKEKELDRNYSKISKVRELRNLIAHYNGNLIIDNNILLKKQKNFNLYNSDKRLIVFENGQVYIDNADYIREFVRNSEDFLNTIIDKIKTTANSR